MKIRIDLRRLRGGSGLDNSEVQLNSGEMFVVVIMTVGGKVNPKHDRVGRN
jgi:hypothetical protein